MKTIFCGARIARLVVVLTFCVAGLAAAADPEVQFGGQCVEGLSQGRHVMTNCALTWTDKDGKVYCFSSEGAKKEFLAESDAEPAEGARLHRRQQRRFHRKGDAVFRQR